MDFCNLILNVPKNWPFNLAVNLTLILRYGNLKWYFCPWSLFAHSDMYVTRCCCEEFCLAHYSYLQAIFCVLSISIFFVALS